MSRSGYSDDIDGWALIRWRGAVAAAIRGTRGQELLHGLATALDALPEQALIADQLISEDGHVCALGALGVACGRADEMRKIDPEDYEQVAGFFGISEALAREIQYLNDERYGDTPWTRWRRMREWVREQLIQDDKP